MAMNIMKQIVFKWVEKMIRMGVEIISLADTVGVANSRTGL